MTDRNSWPEGGTPKAAQSNLPHWWGAVDGAGAVHGRGLVPGRTGPVFGRNCEGRERAFWRWLALVCCLLPFCWIGAAWGQTTSVHLTFETDTTAGDLLQLARGAKAPLRVEVSLKAIAKGYVIEGSTRQGEREVLGVKVLVDVGPAASSVDMSVSLAELVYRSDKSRAKPLDDLLEMPIPYQLLNPASVETSLSVTVGKLIVGQAEFDQVRATLQSRYSETARINVDAKGPGGILTAKLEADARGTTMRLKVEAEEFTPAQWPWFQTSNGVLIERGVTNLQAELTGTGETMNESLATLSGRVFTEIGEGRLISRGLRQLGTGIGTALFKTLNPFVHPTTHTNLRCAVSLAQIQDGVARFDRSLALETDRASLIASGFADLGKGQLDLVARPSVAAGLTPRLGDLAGTIRIHGPLGAPQISVGAPNPLRLGATIATAGQTWLWKGLLETLNPSPKPCDVARHAALEPDRASAPQGR